jgi:hypothetical protein
MPKKITIKNKRLVIFMPTLTHHNSANQIDLRATGATFITMMEGVKYFIEKRNLTKKDLRIDINLINRRLKFKKKK